ncbi:PREDICTED: histone-lysine N-methyltransferase SMYD3-like, partial [Rhagoletis zephyria]|uniref:histone-lysine N-methyltransferase SMYD3-like n=1 Tax=Rhagoletis zephyria TaxID=28612 RepID=UPI00081169D4
MTTSNLGMKQEFVATLKIFDCYDIEDFDCVPVFEYFRQHFHNLVYVFSEYGQVASGNYMSPSVFGHSCFPNATRTFNGCRLDIRAIKEIKKGEPITVSITRVDKSRKKRHSYLEYNYLIDCKCERCTSNFDEEFDYANKERLELEMSKAEHTDQWDKAFQIGKKLIPLYKHLGGYDTSVSWHLMRMAEL